MEFKQIVLDVIKYVEENDFEGFRQFFSELDRNDLIRIKEFGFGIEQVAANEQNRRNSEETKIV